jgi:hypothetical protein
MRRAICLLLVLAACTSAEEKERQRDSAMVEQAKADAAAESEFVADSVKLAASITIDTLKEVRVMQDSAWTAGDNQPATVSHVGISPAGHRCLLSEEKAKAVVVGDTLTCQWTPAQ